MGGRSSARSRSAYRRRFRGERRGVVAVVGTLLALLVFFALFGIFLTQYVPLWMDENENQLSDQAVSALATLKSGVDEQYTLPNIPSYSVPFTMSSNSVPLLAQPTIATLSYVAGCPGGFTTAGAPTNTGACDFERLTYTNTTATKSHPYNQTFATNYLEDDLPNRYDTAVTYFFESDGLFGSQLSGRQWLVAPPPINLTKTNGNLTFESSLLVLLGNASSYSSQGTKDVSSHLEDRANVSSYGRFYGSTGAAGSFTVTMTLGVHDLCGWYNFLYNLTDSALGASSSSSWKLVWYSGTTAETSFPTLSTCQASLTSTYEVVLTVYKVTYATADLGEVVLNFNAGGL